jgi:hypothetical protein
LRKVIILGFPCFLIVLEAILRKCLGLNSYAFMGPCLATAGIGILIALIEPKKVDLELSPELSDLLKAKKATLGNPRDGLLIDVALFLVFVMILTWCWTLYLSSQTTITYWWKMPDFLAIGLADYFVAVTLAIVKEVI